MGSALVVAGVEGDIVPHVADDTGRNVSRDTHCVGNHGRRRIDM
jgi:hypothetical protein